MIIRMENFNTRVEKFKFEPYFSVKVKGPKLQFLKLRIVFRTRKMTFGTYYYQTSFMYSVNHTMVSSSFCTSLNLSLYSIFQIHVEI